MYLLVNDVKKHLNIDVDFIEDDKYIGHLIEVAQQVVEKNIDRPLSDLEDNSGDLPESLLHAMLLMIGNFYANRESVAFASATNVPYSYQYLIDLFRDYKGPKTKHHCKGKA